MKGDIFATLSSISTRKEKLLTWLTHPMQFLCIRLTVEHTIIKNVLTCILMFFGNQNGCSDKGIP